MTGLLMNPKVDDWERNDPFVLHRKIWLEGTGMVGGLRSLAKSA